MKKESKGSEFVQWFGPILDALRELGGSAKAREVTELIARKQNIAQGILEEKTKTGVPRFYNQVAWARQYLVNGGYLDGSTRGIWALTDKGKHAKLSTEDAQVVFANVQDRFKPLAGPLLEALKQLGGSGKPREVSDLIAKNLDLPPNVIEATLKDGTLRFHNQVAWTRDYLVKAGYLDSSSRGTWVLTEKGREAILPSEKSRKTIIEEFRVYSELPKKEMAAIEEPEEQIAGQHEEEPDELVEDEQPESLLEVLRRLTPKGFEEVCGLLLRESGFENVLVTGRSRDGGFDGSGKLAINPFVSLIVTFQCKRYVGTVSRSEVGDFRNSILGRAEKGIFLTTGTFSAEARKEAERIDPKIELVDGEKLVEMFQQTRLGVTPRQEFDVDMQFFEPFLQ
ncbi:MAG: winged helix-turn-helix domain-containing protein [Candidatus Kapaibacterium sp.]|jgi:restriction system protein